MSQPNCNVTFLPFDESGTFTGQLGRYSGGSSYDRSIYNELFNGDGTFSRVLSKISYIIVNPRLNICLLGHANEFIKYMIEERNCKDDGLIQRLLCNAPMPPFLSMEKIKIAREITLPYSLTVLLYIIQRYHKRCSKVNNTEESVEVNVVYKFDDEAEIEVIKYYSQCRSISQKYNNIDSFLV
jgi:hypothetical protein